MVSIKRLPTLAVASLAAIGLAVAGCSTPQQAASGGDGSGQGPFKVGLIYCKTGPLAAYGEQYIQGFRAGMEHVTGGTGKVAGQEIKVTTRDAAADPAKAVSFAKEFIGEGYDVIGGNCSSGVGVQLAPLAKRNEQLYISGAAATDALTGANKYTFRAGRQTYQDIKTATTFVGDLEGKKIVVFAQDSTFGQNNYKAVKAVMGSKGATVKSLFVPPDATDLTPFAAQAAGSGADMLFVAWAGNSSNAMWTALGQQGVFDATKVVTGLGGSKTWSAYGEVASKINFLCHYFGGAAGTEIEQKMIESVRQAGGKAEIFTVDGFTTAQLVAQAARADGGTEAMIKALEGWTFDGVKGEITIRSSDHAVIQPMYQVKLENGKAAVVETVPADAVAPPVAGQ